MATANILDMSDKRNGDKHEGARLGARPQIERQFGQGLDHCGSVVTIPPPSPRSNRPPPGLWGST